MKGTSMTFTVQRLTGERALVRGTDANGAVGETVLSTSEWDRVKADDNVSVAQQAFDEAVEEFFGPLVKAAQKASAAVATPDDPSSYVVVSEGTEGVQAQPRVVHRLSRDSVVLRLIEADDTDRLIWVGGDLEVLAADSPAPTPAKVDVSEMLDGLNVDLGNTGH